MSLLTVTAKGQVTLRKDVLQHLGVQPGEKISVDKLPNGRIEVKAARPSGKISDAFGLLKSDDGPVLSIEDMNRIIADEGLQEHVVFTGYVPSGEVRSWFDLASVAVLPYHRIEQSGAGSLARGAGTPLLTTDVGELAKLGTFPPVPPRDPSRLAESLHAVLSGDAEAVDDHQESADLVAIVAETTLIYAQTASASRTRSS